MNMKNKNYKTCRLNTFLFLIITLFCFNLKAIQMIKISIGIEKNQAVITGHTLLLRIGNHIITTAKRLKLESGKTGIVFDKKTLNSRSITISSDKPIFYNKRAYHRKIEIAWYKTKKKSHLLIIHYLPLEHYVLGTVASEMPTNWPLEALKAQAIAARTYALEKKYKSLHKPYHMESTVLHQVYSGINNINKNVGQAVKQTKGQVIVFENKLIQAMFHSTCGGKTENSRDVWGGHLPYLISVHCDYCKFSNTYRWKREFSTPKINYTLGKKVGQIKNIHIVKKTKAGRAKKIRIKGSIKTKIFTANQFRGELGFSKMPSTWFSSLAFKFRKLHIRGRGFGHGVGLCQWGAYGMAKANHKAKQIIIHYYPGTEIRRMY